MRVNVAPGDPQARAARLRERLDRLAETLYELDSDPDVAFLKAQPGPVGADVVARADELWPRYPLAREAVDRLDAAVQSHDDGEVARLLGPAAVTLPDGATTGLETLIESLRSEAAAVLGRARDIAAAARQSFGRLDSLTAALAGLEARAVALGAAAVPQLTMARRQLDGLVDQLAADPLVTPDATEAERSVNAARVAVDGLESRHASLPGRLARARDQLAEITRLVPEGASALAETRAKIASPPGLLEPLDPAALADGDRGLAPWLDAIAEEADEGAWMTADAGLTRWQQVADGWLANARQVATANRRPLDRRDELRGLLDAFDAKAADSGRAEEIELAEMHRLAHDALWSAPCDLTAAEAAVRRYIDAVNARREGRT